MSEKKVQDPDFIDLGLHDDHLVQLELLYEERYIVITVETYNWNVVKVINTLSHYRRTPSVTIEIWLQLNTGEGKEIKIIDELISPTDVASCYILDGTFFLDTCVGGMSIPIKAWEIRKTRSPWRFWEKQKIWTLKDMVLISGHRFLNWNVVK
jgi:hypothetical protein